jgi:hypothetical protein
MSRRFTVAEAEQLLPEIEEKLRLAVRMKNDHQAAETELSRATHRIHMMGGTRVHPGEVLALRAQRDTSAAGLKDAVEQIHELGCFIKDLDLGLIDFLTSFAGHDVYLCWRLGEPAIEFWHGVDEGFAGRKPIDEDFLERHRGDSEN